MGVKNLFHFQHAMKGSNEASKVEHFKTYIYIFVNELIDLINKVNNLDWFPSPSLYVVAIIIIEGRNWKSPLFMSGGYWIMYSMYAGFIIDATCIIRFCIL